MSDSNKDVYDPVSNTRNHEAIEINSNQDKLSRYSPFLESRGRPTQFNFMNASKPDEDQTNPHPPNTTANNHADQQLDANALDNDYFDYNFDQGLPDIEHFYHEAP